MRSNKYEPRRLNKTCSRFSINLLILILSNAVWFVTATPQSRATIDPFRESEGDVEDYEDINSKALKTKILEEILQSSHYDVKLRPSGENGTGPVDVYASILLRNVENVDDIKMEYTVQMTFRQQWIDHRLKYSHIRKNIRYLQLSDPQRIWMPDVFFSNEKTGSQHKLMAPNLYARIFPEGLVLMSNRVTLILSCEMKLHYYPMDKQSCPIVMSTYGWTTSDVTLDWREENPLETKPGIGLPHFELDSASYGDCRTTVTSSGSYSCIALTVDFRRQFGYYFIQIYVPCAMLVMVSWVSFWLEPRATEARISLCVTTILTVVTQAYGINQNVPPASYIKAIDVWIFTVQFMAFSSILQYSYVNYLSRFAWKKALKQMNISDPEVRRSEEERLQKLGEKDAKRVDNFSKIIFPTSFALFNVVYWTVYLVLREQRSQDEQEIFVHADN